MTHLIINLTVNEQEREKFCIYVLEELMHSVALTLKLARGREDAEGKGHAGTTSKPLLKSGEELVTVLWVNDLPAALKCTPI